MKPYMAYSVSAGSGEGAVLVFAHNTKEAKKVAWRGRSFIHEITDNEYIDLGIRLVKDCPSIFSDANKEKLGADIPHVIESPTSCKDCDMWGYELDDNGYCDSCAEDHPKKEAN